jgi:predicted Zn-dependent peptidase
MPDAEDFFARYYAAGNAVLAVAGDFDPDRASKLVERHFGDVPVRPAPPRPAFAEPDLGGERREQYTDRLAPLPAFAAAWRVPDPIADFAGYLPYVVLAEVLTDGDASRLVRRLVLTDRSVTNVGGYVSFMGEPFDVRDPTALLVQAHLPPGGDVGAVLGAIGEETDRIAQDGLEEGELARTVARMSTHLLRDSDTVLNRSLRHAVIEQQRGDASLTADLPAQLAQVSDEEVRAAAATLTAARRAVVEVIAGGGSQ